MLRYSSGFVFLLGCILALSYACQELRQPAETVEEELATSSQVVHVAFAGGGWRAHTGHSAWMIGLLDSTAHPTTNRDPQQRLETAFRNVATISSNSGGSWFSSMLLYSDEFVKQLGDTTANSFWPAFGWLGNQRQLFMAVCHDRTDTYLPCVFDAYIGEDLTGWTYWPKIVNDLVFDGYALNPATTLSNGGRVWGADKNLLIAASLLNNSVVLRDRWVWDWRKTGEYELYYQICPTGTQVVLQGDATAKCRTTSGSLFVPSAVTPVAFSSLGSSYAGSPLPFPLDLNASRGSRLSSLGYSINGTNLLSQDTAHASVAGNLQTANIPVSYAVATSSAAAGFTASARLDSLAKPLLERLIKKDIGIDPAKDISDFYAAYFFEDEAVAYQLNDGDVTYVTNAAVANMEVKDLAYNKVVRIADGGPADNSGVAQIVSFLQLNEPQPDGFHIVAFDHMQAAVDPVRLPTGAAVVGSDIASLFQPDSAMCLSLGLAVGDTVCVTTPVLQVFEEQALGTAATWSPAASADSVQVVYTQYAVTTVDNPAFGIAAGTTGTLHAFTTIAPQADTAPFRKGASFDGYNEMYSAILAALSADQNTGKNHLRAAFGLGAANE